MPPWVANATRLGAIPHWFDKELLGRLVGNDVDLDQVLTHLRRLSFVRQDARGHFRYHDQVRDYLREWWRQERVDQYEVANRSALAYFRALSEAATGVVRPIYEREMVYDLLGVDEAQGLEYLSVQFEDASGRYQLDLAEQSVSVVAELKDTLTEGGRSWLRYFEARLNLVYRRGDAGEATFQDLADHAPDPVLQAVARWSLGEIRVNQQHWSQATGLYRASLDSLQRERALMYGARVMLAFGDAYRNLADSSGGFHAESAELPGAANRFLHIFQHLPFLVYEWLVRRVSFLPNWYFGTNYQNWIIAYLLIEARRWHRRAERQLRKIGDLQGLAEARSSLAELEHQLGRWSRARRRYALLLKTDEVIGSLYRTARVRMGQGRAFLDEGVLTKAEAALSEAVETFRRFNDDSSTGVTAALRGRLYATLDRPGEAVSAYAESAQSFRAAEDHLAHTRIVGALEDLAQRSTLLEEQKQQVDVVVAQATERHYITRFPDALLRWFRRLALWGALPLTYVFAFVVGLGLTLSLTIIEGELRLMRTGANVQTTITDAVVLAVFATSPILLTLWFYRFIYSLMGIAVAHFLGRQLVPIERDQPSRFVADATGLTHRDISRGVSQTLAWSDVSALASVDYRQRRRPIGLISSMLVAASSGMTVAVDAITAGYEHLKQDIARHVDCQRQSLDFVLFDGRWTLASVAISLAFALYLGSVVSGDVTYQNEHTGQEVLLSWSYIMIYFVPTLFLVFSAEVLWRLVGHRASVQSTFKYRAGAVPAWLLWLAAIVCTAITALWIVVLTTIEF
jgi:tetratricopeptide (TPR) repeat protein